MTNLSKHKIVRKNYEKFQENACDGRFSFSSKVAELRIQLIRAKVFYSVCLPWVLQGLRL